MTKEQEIMIDISIVAGYLISTNEIQVLNSRELNETIIELSRKFILKDECSYMDEIEEYANIELKKYTIEMVIN